VADSAFESVSYRYFGECVPFRFDFSLFALDFGSFVCCFLVFLFAGVAGLSFSVWELLSAGACFWFACVVGDVSG
jgi:hypothetical protein